jgi:hypothetical protein
MKNSNKIIALKYYYNAGTQKAAIIKENRGKSGIYR